MAMELKMVDPVFRVHNFTDGGHWYVLWFNGWECLGNVDENGNKFYYRIECEDVFWNCAHTHAHGYSWFFTKMRDDGTETDADFSNTEIEVIMREMMEMIDREGN